MITLPPVEVEGLRSDREERFAVFKHDYEGMFGAMPNIWETSRKDFTDEFCCRYCDHDDYDEDG